MKDGELILILGGARAGKSSFAMRMASEREAVSSGRVCFIATAEGLDDEMKLRIARHRAERPAAWRTIEEPLRLDAAMKQACDAGIVIVDCLTLFVSNWLLACEDQQTREAKIAQVVDGFLDIHSRSSQSVICVSNEVGLSLVPETPMGREFRDLLGRVNQRFARAAAQVYFLVAGLPLQLKPR